MKIITSIIRAIAGTKAVAWAKGELDKALTSAADEAAKRYGEQAVQLCRDVDASLSSSAKLFTVATDVVKLAAADGPAMPFSVAVLVAERAYAQIKADALTEVLAFSAALAVAKAV